MKHFTKLSKQYANDNVRFQSGMTSEQKYNSIAQSVMSKMAYSGQQAKGCPMHPKPSKKCRKCNQIQTQLPPPKEQDYQLEETFPEMVVINTNNVKSHFTEKLQTNIQNSYLFKTKVKPFNSVRDLVNDLTSDQISIDTYTPGSTQNPTPFFCYFYRLAQLRPTKQQLVIMLRANNVNVRCMGLLYIRTYMVPEMVYACMNGAFKDNKLLTVQTIGQYAMRLLDEEKLDHGGFRLPRLPVKIQRAITKKIKAIKEERTKELERQMERERSRQKQRRAREVEQDQKWQRKFMRKRSSSGSQSSSSQSNQQSNKKQKQDSPKLTLRQKIQQIQQKKAAEARRQSLLASYKAAEVNNLQSEEDAKSQNDQVQKYHMG